MLNSCSIIINSSPKKKWGEFKFQCDFNTEGKCVSWKTKHRDFELNIHVCLYCRIYYFTYTVGQVVPAGVYQGRAREQSQFGPGQVWNYLYNYLHISPAKKNLPGCFSANYFIIVVGALLLMASTALCVGLHEILNRRLALFWST